MAEKIFYSMGEVSEMFDVNPSLIRYWGSQFEQLRPRRNAKGNRMFSPADVLLLKRIYHFVKERGMTLRGAKLALRAESAAARAGERAEAESKSEDMQLYESLQNLRTMLCEVRELLGEEGVLLDEEPVETIAAAMVAQPAESVEGVATEPKSEEKPAAKVAKAEPKVEKVQPKPLFLEQTLF